MSACRSCKAPVTWTRTTKGETMPLDPDPRDDGNIVKTGRTVRNRFGQHVPQVRYLEQGATLPGLAPEPRYVSHFATCPDADDWRRGPG